MNAWSDFIFPDDSGFYGERLDDYLEAGYYRMQHLLFTTNKTQISIENDERPVFWLRAAVNNLNESKAALTIRKKCAGFNVTYNTAVLTQEVNALYNNYRSNIDFEAAETCGSYLHDTNIPNPFNSYFVQIRDGGTLIATGYFDVGANSMAGILNFYHPAYKKYSLGKYLMLKKIDYAKSNNIAFYYTGYISTESNKFDYKIFPDEKAMEVFLPVEKKWLPYQQLGKQKLADYFKNNIR